MEEIVNRPILAEVMPSHDREAIVILFRGVEPISLEALIDSVQAFLEHLKGIHSQNKADIAKPASPQLIIP